MPRDPVVVNGIAYRFPPRPVVVVCIDGSDPAYGPGAPAAPVLPHLERFATSGFAGRATSVVPSFTCPNNVSIVTGAPPAVHGISGNFYLDRATGAAVPMTGPELMRAPTVLAAFSHAGAKVVSITAKDKLRRQLGKDMDLTRGSMNFSSETADRCTLAENGITGVLDLVGRPLPDVYSMDLSLFVLEAGLTLLRRDRPALMYLSLTDYIQHKYAPGEGEANRFYAAIDTLFGAIDAEDVTLALVADHGMNDKTNADGSYRVVWLQDVLDAKFGKGATTVICPITDQYVVHHGALGSFVRVYCRDGVDAAAVTAVSRAQAGVEVAMSGAEAGRRFELPLDREADVVVIGDRDTCIGTTRAAHDLTGLQGHRLRSHGGIAEADVPFIVNRPLSAAYAARAAAGNLRNFHVFDYAINGVAA